MISITATMLLALGFTVIDAQTNKNLVYEDSHSAYMQTKMPELKYYEKYDDLKSDGKAAVIYPILTQSAYDWNGFHDYYKGYCNSCTTTKLHTTYEKTYSASGNGFRVLEFLGYQVLDDVDVDKNPDILKNYDKIILLHNEFVTKKEFDAIMSHPNVVYLYPNALSSEVTIDYTSNTIKLVRGPGHPTADITNGFDWKYDNTKYFNDWDCHSWEFYPVENGHMLNCYPETFIPNYGYELLKKLKSL
ncbi:MAG: hypothetical protein QW177_01820 [Candidatus Nitrosotenuis sp.]